MKFLKKIIELLLDDPVQDNDKKVSDKMLNHAIFTSVFGMLLCLACLFGLTWAWFGESVSSNNTLTAASFDFSVSIRQEGSEELVAREADGWYLIDADKTYHVRLEKVGAATNGYGYIQVVKKDAEFSSAFFTQGFAQLPEPAEGEKKVFTFQISGIEKVKLTPMWGLCTEENDDRVLMDGSEALLFPTE